MPNKLNYIFSRAYFKLWEVISLFEVLKNYKNKPIKVACLAEGPGGFIHCLIDARNLQNKEKNLYY